MQDVVTELMRLLGPVNLDVIFRLLLTMVLCGLVGLERSSHERASGFRPHILVGLGACLVTMAGAYGFAELTGERDALRVASYVVSGIGFMGAGAILRHGTTVRGLTTAATLWGCAGIGVTVATGLGWLAIAGTVLFLFTLTILEWFEARLNFGRPVSRLRIHLHDDNRAVGKALNALARLGRRSNAPPCCPAPEPRRCWMWNSRGRLPPISAAAGEATVDAQKVCCAGRYDCRTAG